MNKNGLWTCVIFLSAVCFSAAAREYDSEYDDSYISESGTSDKRPAEITVYHDEYTPRQLRSKVAGYGRMKRAGTALLIGGIALDCFGTITLISGINGMVNDINDSYESDTYYEDDTPPGWLWQLYMGEIGLTFGIPMTAAGAVLTAIGSKKVNEYEHRLKKVSVYVSPSRWILTYRF